MRVLFDRNGNVRPEVTEELARTAELARRGVNPKSLLTGLVDFAAGRSGPTRPKEPSPASKPDLAESSSLPAPGVRRVPRILPGRTLAQALEEIADTRAFTLVERLVANEFSTFVMPRWHVRRVEEIGRVYFEKFLESKWRSGVQAEDLAKAHLALQAFALSISRGDALESAWKHVSQRIGGLAGHELQDLLEQTAGLAPHRPILEAFVHHLQVEQGIRTITSISSAHLSKYVEDLIARGAPLCEIQDTFGALLDFARFRGAQSQLPALAHRVDRLVEVLDKGECWLALPGARAQERLTDAGFRQHAHKALDSHCTACRCGIASGAWWSDEVLRVWHLANSSMKPEARVRLVRTHAAFLSRSLKLSKAESGAVEFAVPTGQEYLPFQKAGIEYAVMRRRALIGDEMGLGKTVEALGLMNALPSHRRVLIVAPATLLLNWKREAETWLLEKRPIHILGTTGRIPEGQGIYITSYNRLPSGLGDDLRRRTWDLVVADEAHYLKNPNTERSRAFYGNSIEPGLLARADRVLFLTGTPLLNRLEELETLVSRLEPQLWGSPGEFDRLLASGGFEKLATRLRETVLLRREKTAVLPTLPPKRRMIVLLPADIATKELAQEQEVLKIHARVIAEIRREVAGAAPAAGDAAYVGAVGRLRQARQIALSDLARVRRETAVAKIGAVVSHVEGMLEEGAGKIVVWAHHREVIARIADRFGRRGACLTGDTALPKRELEIQRFQNDASCEVFVGSIQAGGQGITLTAAANEVFAELDWVPGNLCQAEDRCHRIGQRESLLIQHIVVDGSLDARMAKLLIEKQQLIENVLGTKGSESDGSALEETALDAALTGVDVAA